MGTNTPDETERSSITWRRGTVTAITRQTPDTAELTVDLESGEAVPAMALTTLVGRPQVSDTVLLNVSALQRRLGTGGLAFVVALPDRLPPDPEPGPGHMVKARYTPLQAMVLGVEEQESPHHDALQEADSLGGLPVVVADLHSSLPAIIAGARATRDVRVAYVMTDGAALAAAFSHTIRDLRAAGWIDACITAGQAFGGDLEATTVHTALLAAREVVGAELVVVAQGPGNLGTGTRWGFSGVAAGEHLNAAAALKGRPIAALRISGADARDRHRGVSHHTLTTLARVALAPTEVALPDDAPAAIREQLAGLPERHRVREVPVVGLLDSLMESPVRLSTMGRTLTDDPAPFVAAAAAGRLAVTDPA